MSIERSKVEGWLRDIGCTPVAVANPAANWQLQINYPVGSPHVMFVVNPKQRPRAVVVASSTQIASEHVEAFDELDDDAKIEFLGDLSATLNQEFVEFITKGNEDGHSCPRLFEVSATRYDDGLSLDSMARSISSVFKAELAGILCVQRHLAKRGFGPGGRFDFRRIGLQ